MRLTGFKPFFVQLTAAFTLPSQSTSLQLSVYELLDAVNMRHHHLTLHTGVIVVLVLALRVPTLESLGQIFGVPDLHHAKEGLVLEEVNVTRSQIFGTQWRGGLLVKSRKNGEPPGLLWFISSEA